MIKAEGVLYTHLGMEVQDGDFPLFHEVHDCFYGNTIEVSLVLPMLQEMSISYFTLHLLARDKVVVFAIHFTLSHGSAGVYSEGGREEGGKKRGRERREREGGGKKRGRERGREERGREGGREEMDGGREEKGEGEGEGKEGRYQSIASSEICLYMHNSHSCKVIEAHETHTHVAHRSRNALGCCQSVCALVFSSQYQGPLWLARESGSEKDSEFQGMHITSNKYFISNEHSRWKSNIIYLYVH